MSKRTVGLIVVLIVITGILFYFALAQPAPQTPVQPIQTALATPTPTVVPAHTVLTMTADAPGTVSFHINTNGDNVTAVQLALSYDPAVLTNVKLTKGSFFDQSIELFNQVNARDGNVSYAVAIPPPPTGQPKIGQGIVATLTYQRVFGQNGATMIKFLDKSKATAEGISPSILKATTDLTIPAVSQ